ncbi:putative signal transducing protein [Rubrivirga sp. IMCC43871]|uniref:putative signal transducing protein n=1 Tax=Rubrivirga sp. IMCC43871 TaxID=3391575 RepID=UPI00398F9161
MIRVYSTPNAPVAHLVRHALEADGIVAEIRGETRAAFVGEIPPLETWIEVWVSDEDAPSAAGTVKDVMAEASDVEPWECPTCGEMVGGQFAVCWSCGTEAPEQ